MANIANKEYFNLIEATHTYIKCEMDELIHAAGSGQIKLHVIAREWAVKGKPAGRKIVDYVQLTKETALLARGADHVLVSKAIVDGEEIAFADTYEVMQGEIYMHRDDLKRCMEERGPNALGEGERATLTKMLGLAAFYIAAGGVPTDADAPNVSEVYRKLKAFSKGLEKSGIALEMGGLGEANFRDKLSLGLRMLRGSTV